MKKGEEGHLAVGNGESRRVARRADLMTILARFIYFTYNVLSNLNIDSNLAHPWCIFSFLVS